MWLQKLTVDVLLLVRNSDWCSFLPTITVFMQTLQLYNDFIHTRWVFMHLPTILFFFRFVSNSSFWVKHRSVHAVCTCWAGEKVISLNVIKSDRARKMCTCCSHTETNKVQGGCRWWRHWQTISMRPWRYVSFNKAPKKRAANLEPPGSSLWEWMVDSSEHQAGFRSTPGMDVPLNVRNF